MDMVSAIDLRAGMAFDYEDGIWLVMDQNFMKPGKGNAVMRVKMKNLRTGSIVDTTINPNNKYKLYSIDKKDMLFSYVDGDNYVFMDNEDYSTIEIPVENLQWYKNFIVEGETICQVMMCEEEVLGIETKTEKVVLEVVQADPAIKGNTAQSARKKVTLQTGWVLEAPLFIEEGDKIVVSTYDGTYCSRA